MGLKSVHIISQAPRFVKFWDPDQTALSREAAIPSASVQSVTYVHITFNWQLKGTFLRYLKNILMSFLLCYLK